MDLKRDLFRFVVGFMMSLLKFCIWKLMVKKSFMGFSMEIVGWIWKGGKCRRKKYCNSHKAISTSNL